MLLQVIAGASGVSVVLSLIFLGAQARELARQTRLNNRIAAAAGMHDSTQLLHDVCRIFVQRPDLRAYFYEGKECPRSGKRRAEVLSIVEMLADAIDYGLMVVELSPDTASYEDWHAYALSMAKVSPVLRDWLGRHNEWYKTYKRLLAGNGHDLG
jgi:hypothetical protein